MTIHGNAGTGVAENMMSGTVRVHGDASQSAGATAHGGLLVDRGHAPRCAAAISMKGVDIVVGGDVGPMSAFMAQAGRLVVCGDAGDGARRLDLRGADLRPRRASASLGADCVEKAMRAEHRAELAELLAAAGLDARPAPTSAATARRARLYHFTVEQLGAY